MLKRMFALLALLIALELVGTIFQPTYPQAHSVMIAKGLAETGLNRA